MTRAGTLILLLLSGEELSMEYEVSYGFTNILCQVECIPSTAVHNFCLLKCKHHQALPCLKFFREFPSSIKSSPLVRPTSPSRSDRRWLLRFHGSYSTDAVQYSTDKDISAHMLFPKGFFFVFISYHIPVSLPLPPQVVSMLPPS